ncbi:hypothetical protein QCA50_017785 [Cerrena zonata]|uniref:Uncharacterized protein n=1 Tax=Cerrena zonata TaxID=2478898 RepID=A0AAW0FG44_9APHY
MLPLSREDFIHVIWHEHCVLRSNINKSLLLPSGNGTSTRDDEPFHLSLLNERIWARDNFWYLAFLPNFPSLARDPLFQPLGIPFAHIPIIAQDDDSYIMRSSVVDLWLHLEFYLIRTYNILKDIYLPFVPVQTTVPPYPQSTGYHQAHSTEESARRAAHRARRLFLGWLCLVAASIAASAKVKECNPPAWYRTIANADPPLPAFWLDKITSSPILTDFSSKCLRRGFVVNMCHQWGFMAITEFFRIPFLPVWLCYPHGASFDNRLAKSLLPTAVEAGNAKERFNQGAVEIDLIQCQLRPHNVVSGPVSAIQPDVHLLHGQAGDSHGDNYDAGGDSAANDGNTPLDLSDRVIADNHINPDEHLNAMEYFFRRRKQVNDSRFSTGYSEIELREMRRRGTTLFTGSAVYIWEPLPIFPWFERIEVPVTERDEVWSSHTPTQRIYDEFEDAWDCAQNFAPLQDVNCNIPGCRDPYHDHLYEEGLVANSPPGLPPHLRDPMTYHQSIAAEEGEWFALSFTRKHMDDFLDVLKFRYGIKVPKIINSPQTVERGTASPVLLEALRGMVQEVAVTEAPWQDTQVIALVEEFYTSIKSHRTVPSHISDCHVPDDLFQAENNRWGLSIIKQSSADNRVLKYMLSTVTSSTQGWFVACNTRTTVREVLRRGWGPGNGQVTRGLLERGIPFSMMSRSAMLSPPPLRHLVCPLYRPETYAFKPPDYRAYIERRLRLFADKAVATAALRQGGILWRLAMESNVDIDSVGSLTTTDNVLAVVEHRVSGVVLFESILTPEVIDAIVGVYKVYTGKGEQTSDVSWWPKDNSWNMSGFNCGHWSLQCEEWFCRRRDAIVSGTGHPRKTKEWQSALRLRHTITRSFMRGIESSNPQVE